MRGEKLNFNFCTFTKNYLGLIVKFVENPHSAYVCQEAVHWH